MDGKVNGLMLRNMKMKPLSAWNSIRLLSSIRSANKSYRKSTPNPCRVPEHGGPLQPPCVPCTELPRHLNFPTDIDR